MSFLDEYLKNNQLPPLDESVKNQLEEIEKKLDEMIETEDNFSDLIKEHMGRILTLVQEIKEQFKDWKPTVGNLVSAFRFILDISNEVAVILKDVSSKIVPAGATSEEARKAKIAFGQELTYFIYLIWDPRIIKWLPLGIETYIEKKVIYFVSGMAIDWALDYIEEKVGFSARAVTARAILGGKN